MKFSGISLGTSCTEGPLLANCAILAPQRLFFLQSFQVEVKQVTVDIWFSKEKNRAIGIYWALSIFDGNEYCDNDMMMIFYVDHYYYDDDQSDYYYYIKY